MALKIEGSSPFTHPIQKIRSRLSPTWESHNGMSPSGKAPDFDSGIRRFESCHPSQVGAKSALLRLYFLYDPLAQQAEQLPFKQWVWSSNLQRVTTAILNKVPEKSIFSGALAFPCLLNKPFSSSDTVMFGDRICGFFKNAI